MKEIVPAPPAIVRNDHESIRELFTKNVVPSYGRFELVLSHGAGSYVFDVAGRRYLDLGSGIAVCCLGHAHPAITEALVEQSKKLIHVSNLYFTGRRGGWRRRSSNASRRRQGLLFRTAARRRTKACNASSRANSATMKAGLKF